METPGINPQTFYVWLENDWFNQTTQPLIPRVTIEDRIRYTCYYILRFLGCTPLYKALVIEEPEPQNDGTYRYPITIVKKKIRLFGIIIRTINTDKI